MREHIVIEKNQAPVVRGAKVELFLLRAELGIEGGGGLLNFR